MKHVGLWLVILFSSSQIFCSIVAPEVKLTGEKTLVENQIIGEYREIEPDAWTVSTVKTAVTRQKGSSVSSDPILMGALKMRELNEDSLRRYKNEEAVGEAQTGYVVYKSVPKYDADKDLKKVVTTIIDDENKARRTMFERSIVIAGKEKFAESDVAALAKQFAEQERSRAQKNDWIQGNDGQWQRKK